MTIRHDAIFLSGGRVRGRFPAQARDAALAATGAAARTVVLDTVETVLGAVCPACLAESDLDGTSSLAQPIVCWECGTAYGAWRLRDRRGVRRWLTFVWPALQEVPDNE